MISIILINSCSSINNLDKYDLTNSKIYFEEIIPANARNVEVQFEDVDEDEEGENNSKDVKDIFADVASEIASGMTMSKLRDKLQNAVKPDEVINDISKKMENTLIKYYETTATRKINDDYKYMAICTLKELKLVSGSSGTFLRVKSEVQITSRSDGEIVWENAEAENVYLRSNNIEFDDSNDQKRLSNILKTIDLATLSEDEISSAVKSATEEVSRLMSESFREAIIEARENAQ
jgi:hypothetical protein